MHLTLTNIKINIVRIRIRIWLHFQLILHMKSLITQIKYVSADIKLRIEKMETYSMLTIKHMVKSTAPPSQQVLSLKLKMPSKGLLNDGHSMDRPKSITNEMKTVSFMENVILPIEKYFSIIDTNKKAKIKIVESLFKSIGPILIKLESMILGTHTGDSANMKLYYNYQENELFEFLIR